MNVCFNGLFFPANQPLISVQNRSYKWGDGLFETMQVRSAKLLLRELHFERLFTSMRILEIQVPTRFSAAILTEEILELCRLNDVLSSARVRLSVFREDEGSAGYFIEAFSLQEQMNDWNTHGSAITIYPYARKSMDVFSNLKSANYLPYVLAGKYAVDNGFDDALVLNAAGYLCDSSKANLFLVKDKKIATPPLHQGCINGVIRRVIIDNAIRWGYELRQQEITEQELMSADEVFLTNAIQTIRWVSNYREVKYGCSETRKIVEAFQSFIH